MGLSLFSVKHRVQCYLLSLLVALPPESPLLALLSLPLLELLLELPFPLLLESPPELVLLPELPFEPLSEPLELFSEPPELAEALSPPLSEFNFALSESDEPFSDLDDEPNPPELFFA